MQNSSLEKFSTGSSKPMLPAAPPSDWQQYEDDFCSNFDRVINADVVAALQDGGYWAAYPAWDFWGRVWYDGEHSIWCCMVMRYGSHSGTTYADSPGELITVTSDEYGYS